MILRILLTALALLLATTAHAHAAPIFAAIGAVASAIGGALAAGGIGAAIVQTLFSVGVNLVGGLIKRALNRGKEEKPAGVQLEIEVGDDSDIGFVAGYFATPGTRKYINSFGRAGKTPNAYLTELIQVGDLPAPGLPEVWANGQKLTLLTDEPHEFGFPVAEYRTGNDDYLWVHYRDGTDTTADAWMIEKFGADPDRPWQADMIGRGCPSLRVTSRFNRELHKGKPEILVVPPPLALYDLRKDSTAGGAGDHRWNDPTTHEPTLNPAVVIYNIIRGIHYVDDLGNREWIYGGRDLPAFRLPASNWIAAANECDVAIDLADGGSEPQFRCGYEVRGSEEPLSVIEKLETASSARIALSGGMFKILVGAPGAAVYAFTDDDIIITEGQSLKPFPTLDATINGMEARYPEPAEEWQLKDAPARYSSVLEAADGDRRLAKGIVFDAVPFGVQVQRNMKTMVEEERRFLVHSYGLPPEAWALEPNDVVAWTSARNGYVSKKFLVDRAVGRRNQNQAVLLKEIDPGEDYAWNPATDEQPSSTGYLGPIRAPVQLTTGWQVYPATLDDAAGNARRPSIGVSFDGDLDDVRAVRVKVRLASSGALVFDATLPYGAPTPDQPVRSLVLNGTFLPAEDYEAQGQYLAYSGRAIDPSAWLPVTTLDIAFGPNDILDGAINELKLADDAVSTAKLQVAAVTQDIIAANAVIASKIADFAVTGEKVAQNAITVDKIVNGAVTSAKIQDAAISLTKFASGIQPVNIIAGTTVPTTKTTEVITVSGKLYRWSGTAYVASVPAVDVTGQLVATQLADSAVTNAKLAAGAVNASKMADGAITDLKLAANAVTEAKLAASAVTEGKIAALAVSAGKIAALAVTTEKLAAGAVVAEKIGAGSIVTDKLAVGFGGNLFINSSLTQGLDGWQAAQADATWDWQFRLEGPDTTWSAPGARSMSIVQNDGVTAGYSFITINRPDIGGSQQQGFSCRPGETLELSAQLSIHRSDARLSIQWYDATGGFMSTSAGALLPEASGTPDNAESWPRYVVRAVAPVGAVRFRPLIVKFGTYAGQPNSYLFVFKPMLSRVPSSATEIAPWTPSGATMVDTAGIVTGAVTADKIEANSIVAGKIAANAVTSAEIAANAITAAKIEAGAVTTAKLAAGAVTANELAANSVVAGKVAAGAINTAELAAGAITTAKLAIGFGGNLLYNADFSQGVDHWQVAPNAAGWGAWTFEKRPSGASWGGFTGTLMLFQPNGDSTGYLALLMDRPDLTGAPAARVPVAPGETLEFSVYLSSHRCACSIQINWYDANGTLFASAVSPTADVGASDQNNPDLWPRVVVQGTAPAGAVSARPVIFKLGTLAGQPNSYLFIHKPMLARVPENATEAAPWANSGGTMVDANGIVANAVTASKIASNTITAAQIAANTITAGQIATGAVAADEIAANAVIASKILAGAVLADKIGSNAVTADKIAANAVTADKILAGAVTAAKISVGSLAAISAVLGNVDISSANIGTLMVGTSNITFQSLTEPTAFGNVGSTSIERAWTTVATLNLPRIAGAFVQVDGYIQCVTGAATSSRASISARLFRVDTNQQVWYETTGTRQGTGSGNGGTTINITRDFALDASSTPAGQTAQYVIQIENPNMSNGNSYWDIQVKVLYWKA